ncbi:TF Zn Ribbon domain containing protein [Pandoravirus neocaledonia]|uniref:TF Zn Ribbon domain containing protein n=1 Tax=Pandoravirus neocaledonia TaxID=2107708 RepID=A0A2U7UBE3_9VIRU|nr:TF Zn Ribbon domain containing protein [Pandoravirus neocaledonia]AVK75779.1 TF Zn Ribbon domain containing protein [Pandoravirus neocaledonia]
MAGCSGCGGTDLFDDVVTGDAVCTTCGWVVRDDRVYGPESTPARRRSRHVVHCRHAFARAESLLCRAARAVAADFGIDPTLLLIEATRAGVPEDVRGPVDVALCRAVARLCGDPEQARHYA